MTFDNKLLFYFIQDALRTYSEDFHISEKQNPIEFKLNGTNYSTHVSYVHDSGNSRTNDDEARIQISRSLIELQRQRVTSNEETRVAFLGFFAGGNTFVAWDPRYVFSVRARQVVSMYARQSQLIRVEENLAAIHQFNAQLLDETSFAIALPAAALGFYLENIERFHQMNSEKAIQDLIQAHVNTFVETGIGTSNEFDAQAGNDRVRFTYERTAYPRDPRFTKRVLGAYGGACCVCGRQLGIVQAAHIIPHSEANCPNTVTNGLAMCIEHHRLYDDALLLPQTSGSLYLNEDRAKYLLQIGQGSGLDEVRAVARNGYRVPNLAEHKPLDEYLQRGLDIRLRG